MSLKRDIVFRVSVVYLGMVLFAVAILGKLFYLQTVDKEHWENEVQGKAMKYMDIEPNRGNIYSSDGRMLAVSVPYYEIRMDMQSEAFKKDVFYDNVDSLSMKLANLFRDKHWTSYKQSLVRAREKGSRYYLVRRNVTYAQLQELKEFPIFRLGRYEGGTVFKQINKRKRPHELLAARTIGYTMAGRQGSVVGIEGAYDDELSGVVGYRLMQKIPSGYWMPVTDKNAVEPRDGYDIVTTIDIELQDVAENALLSQLQQHEADHGSVIVMEVETGKIRAIANLGRNKDGSYDEDYNYAIGESTEPGSTFKLASVIALLEDGFVEPDDIVDVGNGVINYAGHKLADSGDKGLGEITFQEAFEYSSNVGISKLVHEHYKKNPENFINRLYSLGLNQKLGIEIKGEGTPDIKYTDSKLWSAVSLPMMSIGYEVRLTPLQVLSFFNAIANNGELVKPSFVEEIQYHGQKVRYFEKEILNHKICSEETLEKVRPMLDGVVEKGTAKNLANAYYKIAGKTGTCQIATTKDGYTKGSYQASFAGYFPADNPRYSCIVVVSSPSKSVYYGNVVAGPIFREVTDKIYLQDLSMQNFITATNEEDLSAPFSKSGYKQELETSLDFLGIPFESNEHESEWVRTKSSLEGIQLRRSDFSAQLLPDVRDMGAKDAVYLLENLGLDVEVRGRGTVRNQIPEFGSAYQKGNRVVLQMSISEG